MGNVYTLHVKAGDVLLVPGDLHFGICDLPVFELMLKAAEANGVNRVCLLGDNFDVAGLNTHGKSAKKLQAGELTFQHEIDQASLPLISLRALVKDNAHAVALPGNHEGRVARFVDANPEWEGKTWDGVYAPALGGWTPLAGGLVKAGPLVICHGHELIGMRMGGGVSPARTTLANYPGQLTVFGHTHRQDVFTRPTWKDGHKVQHGAWNLGHLSDEREAGWAGDQAWSQSFGIFSFFEYRNKGGLIVDAAVARVLRDRRGRPTALVNGRAFR